MGDRLRPTWDFADLETTERRFRGLLESEPTEEGRADVLTQLARVEGLRGRFEEGDRLADEAKAAGGSSAVVRARVDLDAGGSAGRAATPKQRCRCSSRRSRSRATRLRQLAGETG